MAEPTIESNLRREPADPRAGQDGVFDAFRMSLNERLRALGKPFETQATAARLLGEQLRASRVFFVDLPEPDMIMHRRSL